MRNQYSNLLKSVAMMALMFAISASAQTVSITGSSFPGPPATSCTNTMLDVNAVIGCINAVHQGNTVTVSGTTITVDVDYSLGPICLGAISQVVHNVNLGMLPAGTYSLTVNGNLNAAFNSSVSTSLTVVNCCSAVPSFVTSNDTVCVGDSVYFTNSSIGATSRQWYVNNGSVSTSVNYGRTYNSPGNYAVKLVVSNGTCSDSVTKNVFVSAPPAISLGASANLCPNSSVTLDAGAGRDSVRWSTNATTQTIAVTTPGTYYVDVYKYGCSNRDSVTVGLYTVVPVSLGKDTVVCYGDSLVLNAQQTGATYLWQDASTQSSFKVLAAGTYHVSRTDMNGCVTRDTVTITFDSCSVSIKEIGLDSDISIYPNPAKDVIRLKFNSNQSAVYAIGIYDLRGKLLKATTVEVESGANAGISIEDMKAGMYVIKIADGQVTHTKTFIKH